MNADWQPIESAPKDGRTILVWDGLGVIAAAWCEWALPDEDTDDDGWVPGWSSRSIEAGDVEFIEPTHWRPLPAPPTDSGG